MTRGRYEIEFQGSDDGQNWKAYPFLYKPQDLNGRPRIYAPYQPRFDWNLWFASLGAWRENIIVPSTEERLLDGAPDVLALFGEILFRKRRPNRCARCYGNTGLRRWKKSVARGCGGGASCSGIRARAGARS